MNTETRSHNARAQAIHGSFWTLFGFGGSQVLRLGGNLLLARLLFPEAFGLMALVNVFMHGLQMFSDLGIGPAIIQNPRGEEPLFRHVVWTLQIIRGTALWFFACLMAWPVAHFYSSAHPDAMLLIKLLPVIGITAFLGGFTSTSLYIINRHMKIALVTLLELIPQLISICTMVLWALFVQRSVWAMVVGSLAHSITRLILSHCIEPHYHDHLAWSRETAQELIRFGGWIFASTIVSFLVTNLDRMVLGRVLSLAELGIYSIAMTFARLSMQVTTRLSNTVIFPLLSKRQRDLSRLMELCLRGRRIVLLAGGTICVAFVIFAPLFFELLYDPRYQSAGPLARWLSIYIWCWMLVATIDRVPLAIGKTRILFQVNLLNVFSMAAAIPGYRLFGLPGFIIGLSAAQLITCAYVITQLPKQRLLTIRQSALFTLGFGGYTAAALLIQNHIASPDLLIRFVTSSLLATPPFLLSGMVILREMKRKRAS